MLDLQTGGAGVVEQLRQVVETRIRAEIRLRVRSEHAEEAAQLVDRGPCGLFDRLQCVACGFGIRVEDPAGGTEAEYGSEVTINVGTGPSSVSVPDLSGSNLDQAATLLEDAGLEFGAQDEAYSDAAEGIIISQDPEADSEAEPGSAVGVTVSIGPEPVVVPTHGEAMGSRYHARVAMIYAIETALVSPAAEPEPVEVRFLDGSEVPRHAAT